MAAILPWAALAASTGLGIASLAIAAKQNKSVSTPHVTTGGNHKRYKSKPKKDYPNSGSYGYATAAKEKGKKNGPYQFSSWAPPISVVAKSVNDIPGIPKGSHGVLL